MNHEMAPLVTILAYTDELHVPTRLWSTSQPQNLTQRRRRFKSMGYPWESHGATEAQRKQHQRAMEELVAAGDLIAHKHAGRTEGVRLTHHAELAIRGLCATYSVDKGVEVLERVIRNVKGGFAINLCTYKESKWVPECSLTEDPDRPGYCFEYNGETIKPLIGTQIEATYALVHGWLETDSDTNGRVFYAVTEEGYRIAENPPQEPEDLPEMVEELADFYSAETLRFYKWFQTAEIPNSNDLSIPCPVGCYPIGYREKERMDEC